MRARLRAAGLATSVLVGLLVAWFTANALRSHKPQRAAFPTVPRAAAMRALDGERPMATALAMTLAEEGEAPVTLQGRGAGVWSMRVAVDARECVAVIAAVYGYHVPEAMALQSVTEASDHIVSGTAEPLTDVRAQGGLVTQVQWCQAEARPRMAVVETRTLVAAAVEPPLGGTVHYAIYRGSWNAVGGPSRLRRGTPHSWALLQFPPEYAVAEGAASAPPDGVALGGAVPIHVDGVRLVPGNADTYRNLYARVKGARSEPVNPRVDASIVRGDRWEIGLPNNFSELYTSLRGAAEGPRIHDAILDVPGGRRRVLAVLDSARLGSRCVALLFTRLAYMHRASLRRHGPAPDDVGAELWPRENAVVDRLCPADTVVTYSVDERDQEDWTLQVYALPDPAPPAVAPPAAPEAPAETPVEAPRHGRHHRRRRHH